MSDDTEALLGVTREDLLNGHYSALLGEDYEVNDVLRQHLERALSRRRARKSTTTFVSKSQKHKRGSRIYSRPMPSMISNYEYKYAPPGEKMREFTVNVAMIPKLGTIADSGKYAGADGVIATIQSVELIFFNIVAKKQPLVAVQAPFNAQGKPDLFIAERMQRDTVKGLTEITNTETQSVFVLLVRYLCEADLQKKIQTHVFSVILSHGGTITNIGDGFVEAVWGVPIAAEDDADDAIKCAEDLREYIEVTKSEGETGNDEHHHLYKDLMIACGIAKGTAEVHSTETHLTHAYALTGDAKSIANLLAVAALNYSVGIVLDQKAYSFLSSKGDAVGKQQYVYRKLESGLYRTSPEAAARKVEALKAHETRMRRQSSSLKRALLKAEDPSAVSSMADIQDDIRNRERDEILENSLALYQIVSSADNAFDVEICRALPEYNQGISLYENQEWEKAIVQLESFFLSSMTMRLRGCSQSGAGHLRTVKSNLKLLGAATGA